MSEITEVVFDPSKLPRLDYDNLPNGFYIRTGINPIINKVVIAVCKDLEDGTIRWATFLPKDFNDNMIDIAIRNLNAIDGVV